MESSNLQIYWHESQPVYSLCFQETDNKFKLFTAGGDNKIRAWHLNTKESDTNSKCVKIDTIDFLSSLQQHEQAVNVVRFNNCKPINILASAGDDGQVLLWKQNDTIVKEFGMDETEANELKESWYVYKRLRYSSNSEIYDICWSPDDKYIVVGCMDNCIRIFDVNTEKCIINLKEHNHYVQGVSWDPMNQYIFSQSADRSVHIYKIIFGQEKKTIESLKLKNRIVKSDLPLRGINDKNINFDSIKNSYLFYNETLPSFFRRLTTSPCGSLLCVPAGIYKTEDKTTNETNESTINSEYCNAVYIYTRGAFNQDKMINRPIISIPLLKKPAIVISFNPNFYKRSSSKSQFIDLPYKLIFAIATSNELLIFDTENNVPISVVGNMHYTPLTDLNWSDDGTLLMVSSTDGFCSYVSVDSSLFGEKIDNDTKLKLIEQVNKSTLGSSDIDTPTTIDPIKETDSKTNIPEQPLKKAFDIVNILPVKRKLPTQKQENVDLTQQNKRINVENNAPTKILSSTTSPEKVKKRIQPILLSPVKNEKNEAQ
ncbi:similar to Saccharomyces cerevisiae YML102W CAC2 Component of the chromatin assembly complex (with Rlf2p and Msi1p) that assembles newly synthesized histones onto recently replicated DNA [Maudiozyma saulgeensis]|uniref:Similar to Saccharomyces cerevisiae YML102W CAC2 Component of the chromatin assembly complex (With Rlf2p and Msi1p) that assembles newly synthesized histones onto recently replicated DNA n=1 Tax=Maudiozyma saulgeensis TaxID=1789683 RepID=A0A1X7R4Z5_9SACH|nr:similar to Saccharomyces cerevisiae YML102W CAC2 Component of the chromatin assembly complex (with Rlf2p and Msi1p) that assembles newly synthesized histones onto recently replicated DNA [Kazachstania saulgeensis]